MSREDLFNQLIDDQEGLCAICWDPLPDDRWACRINRFPVRGEDGGKFEEGNTRLICLDCEFDQEGNEPNSVHPKIATAYRSFKLWQQLEGDFRRRIKAYLGLLQNTTRSPYATEETLDQAVRPVWPATLFTRETVEDLQAMGVITQERADQLIEEIVELRR